MILAGVGALLLGLGLAVLLVRTFRSPRLDREMAEQPGQAEERPRLTPPPPSTFAATPAPSSSPRVVFAPPPLVHTLPVPPVAAGSSDRTRDPRYILALREKRVNELRTRLAEAHSRDERATLSVWLDDALRDLSEARRDF